MSLLSGNVVANVFDGKIDLGDGMSVKGISTTVQVGFLTLLESLNYCKVGQYLKCPNWPIWVVGSESHYTVLFALDTKVQEENELENRESQIRKAFDAHDQSGGGGFISVEAFHQIIKELRINLAREKVDQLCSTDFIVWNELWQALLDLDQSLGGLKDPTGPMGKEGFHLYHFNGIAKLSVSGSQASSGNEIPIQRPRLTEVRVTVPPRWTSEEVCPWYLPQVQMNPMRLKYLVLNLLSTHLWSIALGRGGLVLYATGTGMHRALSDFLIDFSFLQNGMTYGSSDLGLNPCAVKDGFDSSFHVRYEVNRLDTDMTMGSKLKLGFRGR